MKGAFNTTLKVKGVLDHEMMPDLTTLTGNGDMLTKNIKVDQLVLLLYLLNLL